MAGGCDPRGGKLGVRNSSECLKKWRARTSLDPARTSPCPARPNPPLHEFTPAQNTHDGRHQQKKNEFSGTKSDSQKFAPKSVRFTKQGCTTGSPSFGSHCVHVQFLSGNSGRIMWHARLSDNTLPLWSSMPGWELSVVRLQVNLGLHFLQGVFTN